ncbi:MAG: Hsp20/alpha crystallin family protein [Bacteroidota bacterium]|nr:Hsp20/alpha crystallin family protein [Bacteroidota bacterium]
MNTLTKTNGNQSIFKPLLSDFFDVDPFFGGSWLRKMESHVPAVNIAENEKDYMIEVVAPGFKKDDFKIKVNDDVLVISAEVENEKKEDNKDYTRREYSFNSFTRSFGLPDNVKNDAIDAVYADGVLKLKMPKTKVEKKAIKEIHVK